MTVKLINPKTQVVREIGDEDALMFRLLKRAGFVLASKYKAPVVKVPEPEPTLAEIVESQSAETEESAVEMAAEKAIHIKMELPAIADEEESHPISISPPVRKLIAKHGLDPSLIEGTGKNGAIKKVDVLEYLAENGEPE